MLEKSTTYSRSASSQTDGWLAWVMVGAAFVVGFVVFGVTYSFGVFFKPIAAEFGAGRAATSAFFAITGLIFYLLGSVAGHVSDRFGPRMIVGAGAVIMGVGLVLTAFIHEVWVGYITYGLGVGIGSACVYVPTLAIIGGWFDKRRNTALGIAAAGTGCGTLLVPPFAAWMIELYGWRFADIVLGVVCAALLAGCAIVVRAGPLAASGQKRPLSGVVRSRAFIMLYVSWVLATTALFVPFVFLPAFATSHGASEIAASALLSLLGGMGILGRVGMGALSERIGMLRLFKGSVLIMAASYLIWLATASYAWQVAFAILLGLGYGIRIALMPAVLIEFFGLPNLGAILGIFFTASGISAGIGPLLAGWIVDATGNYRSGIVFALAMATLGLLAIVPLRTDDAREGGRDRRRMV
ncbi:MAG: MFS transporter [Alphaproteobacteria bacterium]|nr:MFS transporter [Alphaproteobacteria bacterium]